MATIKFLLQSKSTTAPVYLRLSLGKNNAPKRKTGYFFDAKGWSTATGFPKERHVDTKNTKADLMALESHVIKRLNIDNAKGIKIDGDWLENIIEMYHNRIEPDALEMLGQYGDYFVKNLEFKVGKGGKLGVEKDTKDKYNNIVSKLKAFEVYKGKTYLVKDVDLAFRDEFLKYVLSEGNLNENTAGRTISFIKTIVLDAQKRGIAVSPQIVDFKGFTVTPPKVVLTQAEIEKIKSVEFADANLQAAKDWLIISCFVGQRVSDLLRMNTTMINKVKTHRIIKLVQQKTKKVVQIPLHSEVEAVLKKRNGQFPPVFYNDIDANSAAYNKYIKEVSFRAGLNTSVKGNLRDYETKEYILGQHPKWKLVSSHIGRRSFATNFYGIIPTPLLMSVTGHSTELMFLEYIGKEPIDYAIQLAELWENGKNS